jgi:hypothetical protein
MGSAGFRIVQLCMQCHSTQQVKGVQQQSVCRITAQLRCSALLSTVR